MGQEIPYAAGGTLYVTLCNTAQHHNGADVCEPRAPSFTITSALNEMFPSLSFYFFHDTRLYAESLRQHAIHPAISPFLQKRLCARSLLRLSSCYAARDAIESIDEHDRPMVTYWLHLFELQHLVPLLKKPGDACTIPFPTERCTIHAGCLPALPIVEHTKFIVRGKEPLCTLSNASVQLLLTKIFNKALPHVCMFRSLNLTLISVLDNRQVYEFINDVLLVFLTGGYPTATVRPSLTLCAAIVSILRTFDPRQRIDEQHMGAYSSNFSRELLTICARKFQDVPDPAERTRRSREMALSIHNMWVYQFVLLYQVALYEFIHVGGSIWMYASSTVQHVDPRHRAYLDLIRSFADAIRANFITHFEPLAERMVDTPLDPSYADAWAAFHATCVTLNTSLKTKLPRFIVRTRTSVEKRLYKSLSSYAKSIAKPPMSWRTKEALSRLAAVTVCDPAYCGPKFRVLTALGLTADNCERIEAITFGFMGGSNSKHMTDKLCDAFVTNTPPAQVALIEHYLQLCRRYAEMTSAPLDADIADRQRAALLLLKFGRMHELLPAQTEIVFCLAHQECLLTVTSLERRHTHISAFALQPTRATRKTADSDKNEALADIDGPRKSNPSLAISQFTGKAVCSYAVGSKRTSETLIVDNREASHVTLLGRIMCFARFERIVFCVTCGSRCREHHGLWSSRGPTCGIHDEPRPAAARDIKSRNAALDAAFSVRPPVPTHKCLYSVYDGTCSDTALVYFQTWDSHERRYRKVALCETCAAELTAVYGSIAHKVVDLADVERVVHRLFRIRMAKRYGGDGFAED